MQLHQKHRGFVGVDAGIMIAFMLLGIVSVAAMHLGIVNIIVPELHLLITQMPTLHDYDEATSLKISDETEADRSTRYNEIDVIQNNIDTIRQDISDLEDEKIDALKNNDIEKIEEITEQIDVLEQEITDLGYPVEPNVNLRLYWLFGSFSSILLVVIMMISGILLLLEKASLGIQQGMAKKMFLSSIFGLVVIFMIPEVWDPIAVTIEDTALYMLNPFGDGEPQDTITKLWCKMGVCVEDSASLIYADEQLLNSDINDTLVSNLDSIGQDIFVNLFLGFFRITATSMVSLLFFITAIVRIEFTMIIVITMPLWILFRFIPVLKKLSQIIFTSFIGCCFAPIIVALILFVGEQYTTAHPTEALQQWITVLAIATLAQTFLIILAPILQSTISQANSTVSTGIQSTTMGASHVGTSMGKTAATTFAHRNDKSGSNKGVSDSFSKIPNPINNGGIA